MTAARRTALLVALVQVALVALVGAKFYVDRASYPRVWAQTVPVDPHLPIRGRYVRLGVVVDHPPPAEPGRDALLRARLAARDGTLVALEDPAGRHLARWRDCGTRKCWVLERPLAYFVPEHVRDPSVRERGEELWVEATVPPAGPPRPIRLGMRSNGELRPLVMR